MEHYDNTAGGRIDGGEGGTPQAVPPWHGTSGPVATTPPLLIDEVAPFFLASCKGAGIPIVDDFNQPGTRHGAGLYTFAINNGVRDSAARAMLGPILSGKLPRPNLKVRLSSYVK
jgi:choline dehydrogenase